MKIVMHMHQERSQVVKGSVEKWKDRKDNKESLWM